MWAYMILIGKRKVLIWNCKGEKKEREIYVVRGCMNSIYK